MFPRQTKQTRTIGCLELSKVDKNGRAHSQESGKNRAFAGPTAPDALARAPGTPDTLRVPEDANTTPLYLVDGFNLLHAVILKDRCPKNDALRWWDGDHQQAVVQLVEGMEGGQACVVFDGPKPPREGVAGTGRVEVRFAKSADDHIVERCSELQGRRKVYVVSADRSLVDRARHRGAEALSPWRFAHLCRPRALAP